MSKLSEYQIYEKITHILKQEPKASTHYIKQRLVCLGVKPECIYAQLVHFYEQGAIDDQDNIDQHIQIAIQKRQGFNLIARTLSQGQYNHIQVTKSLVSLSRNIDHYRQASLCKMEQFGRLKHTTPDSQSKMILYLQKQGHRLPDIWKALRKEQKTTECYCPRRVS
ncbi:hypothetical protein [Vibrio sp. TBV020]|uniref:hypothetical protein n=1 Tax=Vibrio sp. TBV020 TaxID=3137398 RepID=UPI0038CD72F3